MTISFASAAGCENYSVIWEANRAGEHEAPGWADGSLRGLPELPRRTDMPKF